MKYVVLALAVVFIGSFGNVAQCMELDAWPEPRPLGGDIKAYMPPAEPPGAVSVQAAFEEPSGVLLLRQALTLALMRNPELASFSWDVRLGEARALQAGLLPNPELGIEVENFAGDGDRRGFDAAETTVQLSQLVELGGKRAKRAKLAATEASVAGWDYEAKRLEVFAKVTNSFLDVLAAQEKLALQEELLQVADQVYNTVSERVKAGKVSPIEETRTGVALSSSILQVEKAKRDLKVARNGLAASWGGGTAVFERADGRFDDISPVPAYEQLAALASRNPDIARWSAEIGQREAAVELEKSRLIPDVTISGGIRYFSDNSDKAFVAGVSVPLPLFDRNQGGVLESRYRLAKASEERRVSETKIKTELADAYQTLYTAYEEAYRLKGDVLPQAQNVFDAVSEGYRQGKFHYLDLLDAQRTFFEVKSQYIETLTAYNKAVAEVEQLIGGPIDAVNDNTDRE